MPKRSTSSESARRRDAKVINFRVDDVEHERLVRASQVMGARTGLKPSVSAIAKAGALAFLAYRDAIEAIRLLVADGSLDHEELERRIAIQLEVLP